MFSFITDWPGPAKGLGAAVVLIIAASVGLTTTKAGDPVEVALPLPANPLREALSRHVGITWSENPLLAGFDRLAASQEITIFLDRRVDPGTLVSCSIENVPLEKALREIAGQHRLGVGTVGPVVYVGPAKVASTVATVGALRRQEAQRLPRDMGKALLTRRKTGWPDLSEPRWLVKKLAAEVGFEVSNAEAIPHDLWRATELPAMNFTERMTLVLTGFQTTYQLSPQERSLRILPYPRSASIEQSYDPPGPPEEVAKHLSADFPQALVRAEKSRVLVRSTLEDHWRISRRLSGEKPVESTRASNAAPDATRAYTLRIEDKPLGPLLDILSHRLDLEITYAGELGTALEQRVSFEVDKVTVQQLVEAAVAEAGLLAEFDGRKVTIVQP